MTREEILHWLDVERRTWENECQSKHPIKEALYEARKALEQKPCNDAVDAISRVQALKELKESAEHHANDSREEVLLRRDRDIIRALPPVTPQEPRIGKLIGYIDFLRNTAQGKKKSLNLLEKVVKGELEEIRAEGENFVEPRTGEWIPVTERLPEYGKEVLTCSNGGFIEIQSLENSCNDGYWENQKGDWSDFDEVVAWMPLPEPYEVENEEA